MKDIGYLLLALFLFGCAARNPEPRQSISEYQQHSIVAEYQRLHALTKEFRREAEKCFNLPSVPQPATATERKYRDEATRILVFDPMTAVAEGKTKEDITKQSNTAQALLVESAPPYERDVAIDAIMTVRKSLPTLVCTITASRKENSLHKQLDQTRENALLAGARGQLSSREMAEIGVFYTLIQEELDALAKELKKN